MCETPQGSNDLRRLAPRLSAIVSLNRGTLAVLDAYTAPDGSLPPCTLQEVVSFFVEFGVAVPHLRPA